MPLEPPLVDLRASRMFIAPMKAPRRAPSRRVRPDGCRVRMARGIRAIAGTRAWNQGNADSVEQAIDRFVASFQGASAGPTAEHLARDMAQIDATVNSLFTDLDPQPSAAERQTHPAPPPQGAPPSRASRSAGGMRG